MIPSRIILVVLLTTAGPIVENARAQVGTTTGIMVGTVTDNTKAVMPGVTITVGGPAMMGVRTAVSGPDGGYRVPQLAPGEYKVTFEMQGFGTVTRASIVVTVGFTATLNAEMSPAGVAENVTVTGAGPIVDLASNRVTTTYNAEQMTTLPGSRDFWGVLAVSAPAVAVTKVDVGGNGALVEQGYSSYGLTTQNRGEVEGMVVTEGAGGGAAGEIYYVDFNSFDGMSVSPIGNTAEMPQPGVVTTLISKSGGNQYHADVYQDYQNKSVEAHNIDASQLAAGVTGGTALAAVDTNRLNAFHDSSADLGGYLVRDKMWWYGAYRYTSISNSLVSLVDAPQVTTASVFSGKLTYNLTQNDKLIAYYTKSTKNQDNYLQDYIAASPVYTSGNTEIEKFPLGTWKGEYDAVLGNRAVLELRGGDWFYNFGQVGKSSAVRYEDIGNGHLSGSAFTSELIRHRYQAHGSLTYFKDDWAGQHNFKVGGEAMQEVYDSTYTVLNNQVLVLNNGAPNEVFVYQSPALSKNRLMISSAYGADTWKVNSRLTLNLGLRLDHYRSYVPAQVGPTGQQFSAIDPAVAWNNLGPRIGFVYGLTGDGKTTIKGHYGRYWQSPASDFGNQYNPSPQQNYSLYAWTPANPVYVDGLPIFDASQLGRLISVSGAQANGQPTTTLAANLQNTYMNQALAYVEREVAPNFAVRTGFVWNGRRQGYGKANTNQPFDGFNVPLAVTDPGPDGRVGTADDGGTMQAFNLATQYLSQPAVYQIQNLPQLTADLYTWEITASRRQSGRWSLLGSFAETWTDAVPLAISSNSTSPLAYTPNALINTIDGMNRSKTWQAKIVATLDVGWGVRLMPILRDQSGVPFARTFVQRLNYSTSVTVLAEPFGTERAPVINVFDLRMEKSLKKGSTRIGLIFDAYNIFNANTTQSVTTASGTSFLRPLNITGPRIVRVGVRLNF